MKFHSPITVGEARKLAKDTLSDRRFRHTLNVAEAAVLLAERYGEDRQRAELAALLHDILKERDTGDLLHWIHRSDIMFGKQIEKVPSLWHAYAAGVYVREELGLDEEIANACAYHTAGRAGMTRLEKIVFLADYISADRAFRGAEEVREIARLSLDEACIAALRNGIIHLCKMGRYLDVNSIEAYNDLIDNRSKA